MVAADIPVLREVLGTSASFVDPRDPAGLAAALQAARYDSTPAYPWQAHAETVLAAYRAILSS